MTSRCTIKRGGAMVPDPDDPEMEIPGWTVVYSDLPLRVGGADRGGAGSRATESGGAEVQVAVRVAHFPASTTGLRDDDVAHVTSGEFTGFLRIVEASWQDQATARRVPVVEIAEPEGWA